MFKKIIQQIKSFFKKQKQTIVDNPVDKLPVEEIKPKKKRIGIIVGHERDAPGAEMMNFGFYEYQYNTEIANLAYNYGKDLFDIFIIYRDGIGINGAYRKASDLMLDAVIELHFNSYNTKVNGTETLCSHKKEDIDIALVFQKNICSVFSRVGISRGITDISFSDRGGQSVTSFNGPNCLVEPFFGDNKEDATKAMNLKNEYAIALIKSFKEYLK